MFERFTDDARRVVVHAQEEARERGADHIASEHLLLGVCRARGRGADILTAAGYPLAAVEADLRAVASSAASASSAADRPDRDALASVGIDLDEVRERVEEAFGPGALENTRAAGMRRPRPWGHIPFDRGAKKVLELALREGVHQRAVRARTLRDAVRRGGYPLGSEHVLLGLLHDGTGRASAVLARRGITLEGARAAVDGDGGDDPVAMSI